MARFVLAVLVVLGCVGSVESATAVDISPEFDFQALRLAIDDLSRRFPQQYTGADEYLKQLDDFERRWPKIQEGLKRNDLRAAKDRLALSALRRRALLAHPLLDFDRLLVIQRKPVGNARRPKGEGKGLGEFLGLPRQSSWQQDTIPRRNDWDNQIAVLSDLRGTPKLTTVYRPTKRLLVGDVELDYDADRVLFSMPDERLDWQVFEMNLDKRRPSQLTPTDQPGIHNFDACYLPDGRIVFASTAPLQGVPCNASVNVAMAYRMDADGGNIQQLCFDQDHNYCLTVTNDGRVMYLRWEYTDIPHVWGRYLFTMNPDGTTQREFYGSGSYWPNAIFYARPIPEHPSMVVGIVTGHHVGRVGELVLFDPARGRNSTRGVVQRIPGRGKKVEPLIEDHLTGESWPKFLHPYPLDDKFFLVSAKPTPDDLWGIYLVDVFDNVVLVAKSEDHALLEPIPVQSRRRPPVIADRVDPSRKDAVVYLENVYRGPGLKGVPHGSVKSLRLFTYHFAYQRVAGISHRVAADGPWEPKRVLGTVPVEADGSAMFRVPADTPISIQPLDASGRALQLMRSWMTARPGEIASCVGCHEGQNTGPPNRNTIAAVRRPSTIETWRGPVRGFSFRREVQPVLERYCVGCHDGRQSPSDLPMPDLRRDQRKVYVQKNQDPELKLVKLVNREDLLQRYGGVFDPAYIALRRYVRVGGLESDIRLLAPGEFHADTSELVQTLRKGHHGVELDAEAWDRLVTWIDLNAPAHGTWRETAGGVKTDPYHARRIELRRRYGGIDGDPEEVVEMPQPEITPVTIATSSNPDERPQPTEEPKLDDWPFDAKEAKRRQAATGDVRQTLDLGGGVTMDLVRVPAGRFVMGSTDGPADEGPSNVVAIEHPYWIGRCEVTNRQYARFDPSHESRYEHKGSWSFSEGHLGWPLDGPQQPVVRISQREAEAFCRWLSKRTGRSIRLPAEAQWEYACRAGTAGPFSYGDLDTDFSAWANMADATMRELAYDTDGRYTADLVPRDARFDDGVLVTAEVGRYRANPWGLCDMHGNVWEWTRSAYEPYGDPADDRPGAETSSDDRVARGGSWYDRPHRCRSGFRLSYPAWQKVYNVGFRVVVE